MKDLTESNILNITQQMRDGGSMPQWVSSQPTVTIDDLRDKCQNYLATNHGRTVSLFGRDMTKIVYTLITRFANNNHYYKKFSDGAKNGEAQNSLLLKRGVAVAPSACPPPWDEGIAASSPPVNTSAKLGSMYLDNPCGEVALGIPKAASLGIDAYKLTHPFYETTPTHKGNTMEKIYEERAFVKSADVKTVTDEQLVNIIIETEGKRNRLLDMDSQSKYIRKQIKQYNKDILKIEAVLDGRL